MEIYEIKQNENQNNQQQEIDESKALTLEKYSKSNKNT